MTILLNYRPVLHQPTGIGVYANAVLPALQELPNFLVPGGYEETFKQRIKRLAWTQMYLPNLAQDNKISLIFTPSPEGYLGLQRIPQVVMVHDMRPFTHPELSSQTLYFRTWVPSLLRSCRHILTNSQYTSREIQKVTRISSDKITVIPLGYDNKLFAPNRLQQLSDSCPYLLHVGQAYPHKNLHRLVKAFSLISGRYPDLRLVLAGKPYRHQTRSLKALAHQLRIDHKVVFKSYVDRRELSDLYRNAYAFVYPSLWEGFGIPILEAMASGIPVITSKGSAIEELANSHALLVDPTKISEIYEAMEHILNSQTAWLNLREKGIQRASKFSWEKCAYETKTTLAMMQY